MNAFALKSTLICSGFLCLFFFGINSALPAQSEDNGKADARIDLRYKEANNRAKFLLATVKSKVDDFYQPVPRLKVSFYRNEVTPENAIGTGVTNAKGIAFCDLTDDEAGLFAPSQEYTYLASIENNEKYNDTEEAITVAESAFAMALSVEDSIGQVVITFLGMDENGEMVPIPDVDVGIYVKRLFGLLPVTEDLETTDEDGMISVEFPANIPGDSLGNVIIVAKVDDHERYGYLEARQKVNWGTQVVVNPELYQRELWSSRANAPFYLIAMVNVVLIGIWVVILYIIYEIFKIKQIGTSKTDLIAEK